MRPPRPRHRRPIKKRRPVIVHKLNIPGDDTCRVIKIALFVPHCDTPAVVDLPNSWNSFENLIGDDFQLLNVSDGPTTLFLLMKMNQPEDNLTPGWNRIVAMGDYLLPIYGPFAILFVEHCEFTNLTEDHVRELLRWRSNRVWDGSTGTVRDDIDVTDFQ